MISKVQSEEARIQEIRRTPSGKGVRGIQPNQGMEGEYRKKEVRIKKDQILFDFRSIYLHILYYSKALRYVQQELDFRISSGKKLHSKIQNKTSPNRTISKMFN